MPSTALADLVQVVIALVASGLVIQLFMLRTNRRKIAGEATAQEANAASTLSGAALLMVEAAQRSASDAEKRADHAVVTAVECRVENDRLWKELNRARWHIHWLQLREEVLEGAMRQAGVIVPVSTVRSDIPEHPPPSTSL